METIEQQLKYFSLEYFHTVTFWLDQKVSNLEKYHGKKIDLGEENTILILLKQVSVMGM